MARPTKLTSDVQKRITDAIRKGATYELAAQYGGISYPALNVWMNRGKAELIRRAEPGVEPGTPEWNAEQPFVEFLEALQKAEGEAVVKWLTTIEKAANDGQWQAAAWKLERRYPRDYGRQVHELTGREDGPLTLNVVYVEKPNPDNLPT